jgi:putative FmdB family regulatory protein
MPPLARAGFLTHLYRNFPTKRGYAMPIYGYDCSACGHQFEKLVRSSDSAPTCPACESKDLKRQLSLIADPAKGGTNAGARPCETGGGCGSCPCAIN